jgi:hypothetical protein
MSHITCDFDLRTRRPEYSEQANSIADKFYKKEERKYQKMF